MESPKYANLMAMPELDTVEKRLSPFQILSKLRRETPIRFDSVRNCWEIFAYDDVQRVLKDTSIFSSVRGMNADQSILFMDPPRHNQLRNLVSKAFTPKAIQELAPQIHILTNKLLEKVSGEDMDLVKEIATPLPVTVIAEMLGVPTEDQPHFKRWSDILVESAEDPTEEAFKTIIGKRMQAVKELTDYFKDILKARTKTPGNDLVSALIGAEIEGEKLSEPDLIRFCILLLAAGNETTTNLITNAIRVLTEQPSLQEGLHENLDLVPDFIEEVLRYYPPIVAIGRVAKENVQMGSTTIKAGDQVITWVGAANRDETKFSNPDQFDLHRKPNPHLSFGLGIHFCLGAPLARLEGNIALRAILEHLKDLKRETSQPLVPIQSSFVFGVKNFPLSFKRRAQMKGKVTV